MCGSRGSSGALVMNFDWSNLLLPLSSPADCKTRVILVGLPCVRKIGAQLSDEMKAEAANWTVGGPRLGGRIRSEPRVEWRAGINNLTDHLVWSNSYDNSCRDVTAIAVRTQIRQDLLQDECNMMGCARVDSLFAQKRHDFFGQIGDRLRPRQHIGIESGHGEDSRNGLRRYKRDAAEKVRSRSGNTAIDYMDSTYAIR